MSEGEPERVVVRSYRLVTDRLERRLFKIDRYRLPLPYGVPLRSILYAAVTLLALAVAVRLPLVGEVLGLLPASVRWVALPLAAGIVLTRFEVDGRPPHKAALAWALYRTRPRCLSGLRAAPAPGARVAPVLEIATRPTGSEPTYVPGELAGPAEVIFGYPARLEPEGVPRDARKAGAEAQIAAAKRLRIRPTSGARPLIVGQQIHVPAGRKLIFDPEQAAR